MEYIYELHCHTSEVSGCGRIEAAEIVRILKNKGYSGVVITDHLTPNGFSNEPLDDWRKFVDRFLDGYKKAKTASSEDFQVFLGAEIRFPQHDNDYLLYGIDEDFLYNNPYINRMSLKEFSALARRNNILIVQAHPFRNNMTVVNPDLIDGYEIYNGNKRHQSRNELAETMATMYGKIKTSGSDLHQDEDVARGGIVSSVEIKTQAELCELLQSSNYTHRKTL